MAGALAGAASPPLSKKRKKANSRRTMPRGHLRFVRTLAEACEEAIREEAGHWLKVEEVARLALDACASQRPSSAAGPHAGVGGACMWASAALLGVEVLENAGSMRRHLLVHALAACRTGLPPDPLVHHMAMIFSGFHDRADLVRRLPPHAAREAELGLPLMIACEQGNEACARALIRAGADLGAALPGGTTSLMLASKNGHVDCVRTLLKSGADAQAALPSGHTSLMIACQFGHADCVRSLLHAGRGDGGGAQKKADVEAALPGGHTSLMIACQTGHPECVRALLHAGARVDAVQENGATALMVASTHGHVLCVREVLRAGADASRSDRKGLTPLMCAAMCLHVSIARALLEAGADVGARSGETGECALEWAFDRLCSMPRCCEADCRVIFVLLAHTPLCNGPLVVYLAAQAGLPSRTRAWIVEALRWSTPLHFVDFNSYEWTRSLLRCGADVRASSGPGYPTPVDVARVTRGGSSSLVLRASLPWSPESHDLFPCPSRRRAVGLLLVGRLLASSRASGAEQAFVDVWDAIVMPLAVTRELGYIPSLL